MHAGGGVFNDIFFAEVADLGAMNPPYAAVFAGGINGQVGGMGIAPNVAGSLVDATSEANRTFQNVFRLRRISLRRREVSLSVRRRISDGTHL